MDDFQRQIKDYLKNNLPRGSHNWNDYEAAKDFIGQLGLSSIEYSIAIEIIVDYLEV